MGKDISKRTKSIYESVFRLRGLSYYWEHDVRKPHPLYGDEAKEAALTLCDEEGRFDNNSRLATSVSYTKIDGKGNPIFPGVLTFPFQEFIRMRRPEFISETKIYQKSTAPKPETSATS